MSFSFHVNVQIGGEIQRGFNQQIRFLEAALTSVNCDASNPVFTKIFIGGGVNQAKSFIPLTCKLQVCPRKLKCLLAGDLV